MRAVILSGPREFLKVFLKRDAKTYQQKNASRKGYPLNILNYVFNWAKIYDKLIGMECMPTAQFDAVGLALYLHQIKHGARSAFDVSFIFQILQHVQKTALFEIVFNCQNHKNESKTDAYSISQTISKLAYKKEFCKMHLFLDV